MIKPRRSIRTDLPFRVSRRSRPSDKGGRGGGGKERSLKKFFQFGLKIRGGPGSTTQSNRIFINGGSYIPMETTRAWESCLFFEGDARWVHPSSQANLCVSFKWFTMFCIKENVWTRVAQVGWWHVTWNNFSPYKCGLSARCRWVQLLIVCRNHLK